MQSQIADRHNAELCWGLAWHHNGWQSHGYASQITGWLSRGNTNSDDESTTEENLDIYETDESLGPPTPTQETETMANGNASGTTTSRETKKKMKAPTPFSGKREDLRKFLQEIKIYLLAHL